MRKRTFEARADSYCHKVCDQIEARPAGVSPIALLLRGDDPAEVAEFEGDFVGFLFMAYRAGFLAGRRRRTA